jgi:S1-C subfamily serine protease
MSERTDVVTEFSHALASRADDARASVVAVRSERGSVSGVLWEQDVVATSAQSLPAHGRYETVTSSGDVQEASLCGMDQATNVAVLKLATPLPAPERFDTTPRTGELVLAYGADHSGTVSARLGVVALSGEAWYSEAGGQIDRRIVLDVRLGPAEEGGPTFDARGAFIGMSTFGARRSVIAIPGATLARIVPVLMRDGHVPRGWLGIALQPVAVPETLREAAGQSAAMMAMAIAPEGPAAKAGLLAGDIVLSIDGKGTQRYRNLMIALGSSGPGHRVEVRVIRSGEIQAFPLTIAARPKG